MASLPAHYHDLLSHSLVKDPAKRIRDGSELLKQINVDKTDRPTALVLKSLCGDIPEEYDAPKTSPSETAAETRKKKKPFPAVAAFACLTIAVFAGVAIVFFGGLPGRSSAPDVVEPKTAPAPAPAPLPAPAPARATVVKPVPRDTALTNRAAQEVIEKIERETPTPSSIPPMRKQKPKPQQSVRPVTKKEAGPNLLLDDTSNALLDSFNMISPESAGKNASNPSDMPARQGDTGLRK